MKAVLVIDKPNRCGECPLCSKDENYWGDIVSAECQMQYKGYVALNEKPYWCPLRPLPEKKEMITDLPQLTDSVSGKIARAFIKGYNACINEITGETE